MLASRKAPSLDSMPVFLATLPSSTPAIVMVPKVMGGSPATV